jgi:hypothetical protein
MQRALTVTGFTIIAIAATSFFLGPEAFIMLGVFLFLLTLALGFIVGRS